MLRGRAQARSSRPTRSSSYRRRARDRLRPRLMAATRSTRWAIPSRRTASASPGTPLAAGWFAENGKIGAIVKQVGWKMFGRHQPHVQLTGRPRWCQGGLYTRLRFRDFDHHPANRLANPVLPTPVLHVGPRQGMFTVVRNASGREARNADEVDAGRKTQRSPCDLLVARSRKSLTLPLFRQRAAGRLESITVASTKVRTI